MANYLANKRFYLSGPIQFCTEKNWRPDIINRLVDEFKINVFDPFSDPKQQWAIPLQQAQANKDYAEMRRIAKMFVKKDLSMVNHSNAVIAYLPYKVCTTGTIHEVINCVNEKKPSILICPEGKEKIPLWFYGFIPDEFMFGNWEDVFDYLRKINQENYNAHKRWDFIREKL